MASRNTATIKEAIIDKVYSGMVYAPGVPFCHVDCIEYDSKNGKLKSGDILVHDPDGFALWMRKGDFE